MNGLSASKDNTPPANASASKTSCAKTCMFEPRFESSRSSLSANGVAPPAQHSSSFTSRVVVPISIVKREPFSAPTLGRASKKRICSMESGTAPNTDTS
jgi:hypothetical protein